MRRLTLLLTPLLLSACGDAITAPEMDAPAPVFSHSESLPPSGLIGYWNLDGDAQDSGPNGLHGTVFGALPTLDQHGTAGAAMAVAGGTHMAVPDNALLDVSGDFSLTFWIRADGSAGSTKNFIVGKGRDVDNGYNFYREGGSNVVRFYLRGGLYDPKIAEVSATVPPDEWHHLAAVVENGTTVSLFLDGVLASQSAMFGPFVSDNAHPLVFGRHYTTPEGVATSFPFPFAGDLDEIRLYGRALTVEEVAAYMSGGYPEDTGSEETPPEEPDEGSTVPTAVDPATKQDCKNGGWADFGFKNQGQCVRFVETGKDSR